MNTEIKLDQKKADEIRKLRLSGASRHYCAGLYAVSYTTIKRIDRNQVWVKKEQS